MGATTPKFELGSKCDPQVSSSYVYLFESYRVNKHTNTYATENIQRSSLRYDVG